MWKISNRYTFIFCILLLGLFVGVSLPLFLTPVQPSVSSSGYHVSSTSSSGLGGMGGVQVAQPVLPGITPTPDSSKPSAPAGCVLKTDPSTAFKTIWPSLAAQLADNYSSLNYSILCLDKWSSTFPQLTCTQSMQSIFTALGWPTDLLKSPYSTYVECIGPLTTDQIKTMTTLPQAAPPTPPTSGATLNCVWDLGDWTIVHPVIPICNLMTQLLKGVLAQPMNAVFQQVNANTSSFLWTTPARLTYENKSLLNFWSISLGIVMILLVSVLSWGAIRSMLRSTDWLSYANVLEVFPRVVVGVLAAYGSLAGAHFIIDASNAFSTIFSNDMLAHATQGNANDSVTVILQILTTVVALLLVIEEGVRFVALYVLIGFAPLWAFAICLKETQGIAKAGFKGLILFALVQPAQNALLDLGQSVITTLTGDSASYSILSILTALGIMILALSLIFVVARTAISGAIVPIAGISSAPALVGRLAMYNMMRNTHSTKSHAGSSPSSQSFTVTPINTNKGSNGTGQSGSSSGAGTASTPSFLVSPVRSKQRGIGTIGNKVAAASAKGIGSSLRYTGKAALTIAKAPLELFQPLQPLRVQKVRHRRSGTK